MILYKEVSQTPGRMQQGDPLPLKGTPIDACCEVWVRLGFRAYVSVRARALGF